MVIPKKKKKLLRNYTFDYTSQFILRRIIYRFEE